MRVRLIRLLKMDQKAPNPKSKMSTWFETLAPVTQALLAGIFTWGVTALGAALVFFTRTVNRALLDAMMGFAAGVMIAASFFSLLVPSIDMAEAQGLPTWLPATAGFLLGGIFLRLADQFLPHLHVGAKMSEVAAARAHRPRHHGRTHRLCRNDVFGCGPWVNEGPCGVSYNVFTLMRRGCRSRVITLAVMGHWFLTERPRPMTSAPRRVLYRAKPSSQPQPSFKTPMFHPQSLLRITKYGRG